MDRISRLFLIELILFLANSASLPSISGLFSESDSDSSLDNFNLQMPARRTNSESNSIITANQLSAALAYANNTSNSNSATSIVSASTNGHNLNRSQSATVITSSMFSNALRHAMGHIQGNPRRSNRSNAQNGTQSENRNFATQLRRMRELGLTDHAINLQALVICDNDLQAAINLILSGAIENND